MQKVIPLIETHPYSDELEKQVEAWKGIEIKDDIDISNMCNIGTFSLSWSLENNIYKKVRRKKVPIIPISPIPKKSEEEEPGAEVEVELEES